MIVARDEEETNSVLTLKFFINLTIEAAEKGMTIIEVKEVTSSKRALMLDRLDLLQPFITMVTIKEKVIIPLVIVLWGKCCTIFLSIYNLALTIN